MNEKATDGKSPGDRVGRGGATGGFRQQPLALRLLLIVSIAAVTVGVVRCSFELTKPLPDIGSVAVLVAPGSPVADAVHDSVAARYADALSGKGGVETAVVTEAESGADALAVLRPTTDDGMLTVAVELSDSRSRRYLGAAEAVGPEAMAGDVAALAAERSVPVLGLEEDDETEE